LGLLATDFPVIGDPQDEIRRGGWALSVRSKTGSNALKSLVPRKENAALRNTPYGNDPRKRETTVDAKWPTERQ
jgi:hypothetical protein